jgi:hypothetical protein
MDDLEIFGSGPTVARNAEGREVVVGPAYAWGFAPRGAAAVRIIKDGVGTSEFAVHESNRRQITFFLVDYDLSQPGHVTVQAVAPDGTILAEQR